MADVVTITTTETSTVKNALTGVGTSAGGLPWWQSKTIWCGILTAVIGAAQAICLSVFKFDLLANPIAIAVIGILGALGVYSRTTATQKIQ
jgi:uncharacterized membrane protein